MGDLVAMRDRAIKTASVACQLDKEKKYDEAFHKYVEAMEYFNHVIKCTSSSPIRPSDRREEQDSGS